MQKLGTFITVRLRGKKYAFRIKLFILHVLYNVYRSSSPVLESKPKHEKCLLESNSVSVEDLTSVSNSYLKFISL